MESSDQEETQTTVQKVHCCAKNRERTIQKVDQDEPNKRKSSNSFLAPEKKSSYKIFNTTQKENRSSTGSKIKFDKMALFNLWFVLFLTLVFSILLLIGAHMTHSLTLQVEAYHSLYNLMALAGCLVTIHVCQGPMSLKNTFGWARVEVLSCLITLIFLFSLCFSVAMESIQTAARAPHQDAMHHPIQAIALGAIGLCLNVLVYFLIGGYTHHQRCFLDKRSSGVWIREDLSNEAVQVGMRTITSRAHSMPGDTTDNSADESAADAEERNDPDLEEINTERSKEQTPKSYENVRGILRDIVGLLLGMFCAAIVYWDESDGDQIALYVDPAFAITSVCILLYLSYPYAQECCAILLQTNPEHINVLSFSAKLLQKFPEMVNVHHLHIWSLTPGKVIATAHVVFSNPGVYHNNLKALEDYFHQEDITQVTLQPEFVYLKSSSSSSMIGSTDCFLKCEDNLCQKKECCQECPEEELIDVASADDGASTSEAVRY